jgi:hypothetical protein
MRMPARIVRSSTPRKRVNLVLLGGLLLSQVRCTGAHASAPATAAGGGTAEVLRGRALEIVDGQGRLRACIKVLPPVTMEGKRYPETVLLRLIDPNGRPEVKLGASVEGAGLGLGGESDPTYVVIKAEGAETSLKLTNKDGKERVVTP